ncbi:hypothetical protein N7493_004208 [Penicillium malachiteum]|uniref:Uncharacterized protein n=1 Tax=Penicillium malachiteum TaxID=1324776 RepID=A0AAD6MY80_9EURO|nr:hypothetical protein N7493_004208 [Penicillium malachiteum]
MRPLQEKYFPTAHMQFARGSGGAFLAGLCRRQFCPDSPATMLFLATGSNMGTYRNSYLGTWVINALVSDKLSLLDSLGAMDLMKRYI